VQRERSVTSFVDRPPGFDTIEDFLANVTATLVKQPWLDAFGGVVHEATIVRSDTWLVRDRTGHALPLRGSNHWKALAISGGHPCDIAWEWNGDQLRLLGLLVDGQYWNA
jgi:hypothetical protein